LLLDAQKVLMSCSMACTGKFLIILIIIDVKIAFCMFLLKFCMMIVGILAILSNCISPNLRACQKQVGQF
jgi:hypothetical protein